VPLVLIPYLYRPVSVVARRDDHNAVMGDRAWWQLTPSAPCCSVSPLRVGIRVVHGVRLVSWVGAILEWSAYRLVPPSAALASAGRLGDLSDAKVKRYEGSIAKSLSIEIVRVVFTLLSDNARVFLQECQRTRGLPAAGRLRAWAALGRNRFIFFMENRNSVSF